jgi:protein phosphatase
MVPLKIEMIYYSISEKGIDKERNEDSFFALKKDYIHIFGIADGLGGLPNGDIASNLAIETIKKEFEISPRASLSHLFEIVNDTIINEARRINCNMATTLVACAINDKTGEATIGHIGDSRAYIFNDNIWRTKDQSLVQDLVDLGIIDEEGAFLHPEKHRMKQALGFSEKVKVEITNKNISNSTLLLCSDGLSDFLRDHEIRNIATKYKPKKACEKLLQTALAYGSCDDITMIIVNPMK